jgi:hypothetical protein
MTDYDFRWRWALSGFVKHLFDDDADLEFGNLFILSACPRHLAFDE